MLSSTMETEAQKIFVHKDLKKRLFSEDDSYTEDGHRLSKEFGDVVEEYQEKFPDEDAVDSYVIADSIIMTESLVRLLRDNDLTDELDNNQPITEELARDIENLHRSKHVPFMDIKDLMGKRNLHIHKYWNTAVEEFLNKHMEFRARDLKTVMTEALTSLLR